MAKIELINQLSGFVGICRDFLGSRRDLSGLFGDPIFLEKQGKMALSGFRRDFVGTFVGICRDFWGALEKLKNTPQIKYFFQ